MNKKLHIHTFPFLNCFSSGSFRRNFILMATFLIILLFKFKANDYELQKYSERKMLLFVLVKVFFADFFNYEFIDELFGKSLKSR